MPAPADTARLFPRPVAAKVSEITVLIAGLVARVAATGHVIQRSAERRPGGTIGCVRDGWPVAGAFEAE